MIECFEEDEAGVKRHLANSAILLVRLLSASTAKVSIRGQHCVLKRVPSGWPMPGNLPGFSRVVWSSDSWVAWEFVEGTPLDEHVFESVEARYTFALSMLDRLSMFYERYPDMIHGDLHKGNILVTPDGSAHFIDVANGAFGDQVLEERHALNIAREVSGKQFSSIDEARLTLAFSMSKPVYTAWFVKSAALFCIMLAALGVMQYAYVAVAPAAALPRMAAMVDPLKIEVVIEGCMIILAGRPVNIGDTVGGARLTRVTLRDLVFEDGSKVELPPMVVFGAEMSVTGRSAVYPGAIEGVVGYFEVSTLSELQAIPRGTIGWSPFARVVCPILTLSEIGSELNRLGIESDLHGPERYAVGRFGVDIEIKTSPVSFSLPTTSRPGVDLGPEDGPDPVMLAEAELVVRGSHVWHLNGTQAGTIDSEYRSIGEAAGEIFVFSGDAILVYSKEGLLRNAPSRVISRYANGVISTSKGLWFSDFRAIRDGRSSEVFFDESGGRHVPVPKSIIQSRFDFKNVWSIGDYLVFKCDSFARYAFDPDKVIPFGIPFKNRTDLLAEGLVPVAEFISIYQKWYSQWTVIQGVYKAGNQVFISWGSPLVGDFSIGSLDGDLNTTEVYRLTGYPLGVSADKVFYYARQNHHDGAHFVLLSVGR